MDSRNILNTLLHGKNIKLLYYLRNFLRYMTPKPLFRMRLARTLAQARRRPDWDYICDRVAYYNKLERSSNPSLCGLYPLGEHRFGRKVKSVYFFDSYEFTRWFPDHLLWQMIPGDQTQVPPVASILKSRPIAGNNANCVLLNMDKVRHFVFLKDNIPFADKSDKAIFRLAIGGRPHREQFVRMYCESSFCDVGVIPFLPHYPARWAAPRISIYDHLRFKFVICIEGNDVATNLKWVMSSNSLAVMPRPTYETWFMEGRLIPDYHYVEIKSDYSDLEERMQYYIDHPAQAEAIIAHAHQYIDQFRDRKRERLISLCVLQRYFERTGQL